MPALVDAGFEVIVPDLRGYGASNRPVDVAAWSLPFLAGDACSTSWAWLTEVQMTYSGSHVTGPWRYERNETAGHWLQLETPGRVTALLVDFLEC